MKLWHDFDRGMNEVEDREVLRFVPALKRLLEGWAQQRVRGDLERRAVGHFRSQAGRVTGNWPAATGVGSVFRQLRGNYFPG